MQEMFRLVFLVKILRGEKKLSTLLIFTVKWCHPGFTRLGMRGKISSSKQRIQCFDI